MPLTLDILEIGARGDGIAEQDGERYFVPFTLPGEMVEAEPRDKRGEGIAADLVEVLAPSRHRETPPCAHFTVCGGCALQHWRRDAYTALEGRPDRARAEAARRRRAALRAAAASARRASGGVPTSCCAARAGACWPASTSGRARGSSMSAPASSPGRPSTRLLEPLRATPRSILPDGAAADADRERDRQRRRPAAPAAQAARPVARTARGAGGAGRARRPGAAELGRSRIRRAVVVRRAPLLLFGEARVEPPPGAFLQATKRAEQAMRAAVRNGSAMRRGLPICSPAWARCRSAGRAGSRCSRATSRRLRRSKRRRAGSAATGDGRAARSLPQSADGDGARRASMPSLLDPPRAGAAAQVGRTGALEGAARGLRLVRSRQLRARRAHPAGRRIPAGETAADRPVPVVAACRADCAVRPRAAKVEQDLKARRRRDDVRSSSAVC